MSKIMQFMNSNKAYKMVAALFLIICLAIGVLCLQYYWKLQDTVTNESSGYLQEISKQIGANASRTIDDNFSVLETVAMVLQTSDVETYSELQPVAQAQQDYWNYETVMLIDERGIAYNAQGTVVTLQNDEYLRQAIIDRERSMSASQVVGGKECIVFVIPVEDLVIDGINMRALAASYDLGTFDQILSMSAFDGKGYSMIIRRDGSVVVRSSSENAFESGYNVLSTLSTAVLDKGGSLSQVKADIANGKSGMAGLTYEGKHVYLSYTPVKAKEWCILSVVPVSVVNAKSQLLLRITLMLCSIITLAFGALILILMLSAYYHKKKLEQIAFVDPVTGGNTIQKFYLLAEERFNSAAGVGYALIFVNVEKFKVLNEQYGRVLCDKMLQNIERGIASDLTEKECMGRLFADNFCVLAEGRDEAVLLERMNHWYENAKNGQEREGLVWLAPIMEFGVYHIENEIIPFTQMVDRAKLALREADRELHGKLRCAVYNDAARRALFREKQLEDMMEEALQKREFQVYLQPKYRLNPEHIGGAEALIRWISPSEGMIYPDEFISLFEKNGFIVQLDSFVLEEVCRTMRKWLDAGLAPVKVSVNCSRVHLRNMQFLSRYQEICSRYEVPTKYIEIEVTENVVFEDVALLAKTIDSIHEAGFGCSMDDFGSGYSSLSMIKDIPVDTIKLDKVFFRDGAKDFDRMESVISSILDMSRSLHMETVAEGVEERVQVDMLKRLGCDLIQGYFFAKPMPIVEFEKLAYGSEIATSEK